MSKPTPAAIKAMTKARAFPHNTCGASRHAAIIAEQLVRGRPYPMLAEEPEHCGESIAYTVAAAWQARTQAARLRDALQALHDVCRAMDAELEGERPTEREYHAAMRGAVKALRSNGAHEAGR